MSTATITRPAGVPTRGAVPAGTSKEQQMPERMLSPSEVAHRLNVSEESVRRWIRNGKLPATKIGDRLIRIPESAIAPRYRGQEDADGE